LTTKSDLDQELYGSIYNVVCELSTKSDADQDLVWCRPRPCLFWPPWRIVSDEV